MTGNVVFERKLTDADKAALARADAVLDHMNPAQLRGACEWLLLGLAIARPTNQSMAEYVDKMQRQVGA